MTRITLKHLIYFEALATHCHFGRAAAACGVSQPALSLQIKELETMLDAPLVERMGRQTQLTPLGEDVAVRARRILLQVEDLGALARINATAIGGHLRLGIIPTIAPYRLVSIVRTVAARFPSLALEPREALTRTLIADLLQARLDLALVALPVSEPLLEEMALHQEDFVLVRPAADAGRPIPCARSLAAERLLLLEEGHCFRDQALSWCGMSGTDSRAVMEGSSLATLVQMVDAGLGITLLPDMALALETRSAAVVVDRLPAPVPGRTLGLIWRKTTPLAGQLRALGQAIQESLAGSGGRPALAEAASG